MNNLKKIGLTALAGSLVASSAYAGALSVSGSAGVKYQSKSGSTGASSVQGNPYSDSNGITFSGSGDLDNGMTVGYSYTMTDAAFSTSNVTLDRLGASRSAGGISISPYDLLTLAELTRCEGSNNNGNIIPESWIQDFVNPRDNSCYLAQDNLERFPKGNYRSKWYQTGFGENQFCAIGIHGQNIWVNPKKELTIIRMSSASDPINIKTEELMFSVFEEIGNYL